MTKTLELQRDLKGFIDHVEEQNVLMAELYLSHGYNPEILDELCENHSGHKLQEFVHVYERLAREARAKWKFPREFET